METPNAIPNGLTELREVAIAFGEAKAYRRMARYVYALADANKANIDAYLALSNAGATATRLAIEAEEVVMKAVPDAT